jgi:hypothetical protein
VYGGPGLIFRGRHKIFSNRQIASRSLDKNWQRLRNFRLKRHKGFRLFS